MDSEFQQQPYQHHFQGQQKQINQQKQQLTRFRSAPSSYFASFLDAADTITNPVVASGEGKVGDLSNAARDFSNSRPLSPETESIFARFMDSMDGGSNSNFSSQKLSEIPEYSPMQPELMVTVKQESEILPQQLGNYNTNPQMIYPSASKPPLANQQSSGSGLGSLGVNFTTRMKKGIGGSTGLGLARHNSTPAGFFSDLIIDGFEVMRGMENYGSSNANNNQMNHPSGQPSSTSGLIRQNSDVQGKIMRMNSLEETKFSSTQNNDGNFSTGLPISSWENSILSETMSSLDGEDDKRRIFAEYNSSENQTGLGENRNRLPLLAHQLSLPNTSAELSAMERLLHQQDAVPLRIRAKRGFATHPRSIAERVRKNKISERMRKLQDLVPNMDKQTNTADMLDLAVDHIKNLQHQVKRMRDNRAKCTCPR